MSEESQQTYSAREIVLEFFPATHERLVPGFEEYRLEQGPKEQLFLLDHRDRILLRLTPVSSSGNANTQLCCDFCHHSAPRHHLQHVRTEVPGSQGRRYRYLSVCRDPKSCELRRFDDGAIRALLERLAD